MYEELLGESGFYRLLLRFDEELAARTRALGCWRCGKALHVADFTRKPRGIPAGLGERYNERFSFCCAGRHCRKRRTCPSLRFLSRKVYLATVVVLVSALRSGPSPRRVRYLQELVGVSRRTILDCKARIAAVGRHRPQCRRESCEAAGRMTRKPCSYEKRNPATQTLGGRPLSPETAGTACSGSSVLPPSTKAAERSGALLDRCAEPAGFDNPK